MLSTTSCVGLILSPYPVNFLFSPNNIVCIVSPYRRLFCCKKTHGVGTMPDDFAIFFITISIIFDDVTQAAFLEQSPMLEAQLWVRICYAHVSCSFLSREKKRGSPISVCRKRRNTALPKVPVPPVMRKVLSLNISVSPLVTVLSLTSYLLLR